jgi:ArsR family transcriptional regulator, zinc-responsive transcriptional repressor
MKKLSYELFFKVLGNKTRLGIVEALKARPMNVSQICDSTGFEQSRVSHNLRYLQAWGFVDGKRDGKNIIYCLDRKNLLPILEAVDGYMSRYDKKLCTCGILKGEKTCKHLKEVN